ADQGLGLQGCPEHRLRARHPVPLTWRMFRPSCTRAAGTSSDPGGNSSRRSSHERGPVPRGGSVPRVPLRASVRQHRGQWHRPEQQPDSTRLPSENDTGGSPCSGGFFSLELRTARGYHRLPARSEGGPMRRTPLLLLIPATLAGLLATFSRQPARDPDGGAPAAGPVATFSILGFDPATTAVGAAGQSPGLSGGAAALF